MVNEQKASQRTAILNYLKEKGKITSMQAIRLFGATRLSAIIYDLRKSGYIIDSEMITVPTRWGNTQVAEYKYIGKE